MERIVWSNRRGTACDSADLPHRSHDVPWSRLEQSAHHSAISAGSV